MADSEDIIKQITLLQAYIQALQTDVKCINGLKKDCVEFRLKLNKIDEEMVKLWEMRDQWITHQEESKQISKSLALLEKKHRILKERLKNYKQIEETYLEFRSQVIKVGIVVMILIVLASISLQLVMKYYSV